MKAFLPGLREALGAAGVAMAATFLAFGAAVREAGLSPAWAVLACWGIYGMPGQLILVQAATLGWAGGVGTAVMGAVAVNARFLPMAVSIAPVLSSGSRLRLLPAVPFIAITPWAAAMRALPAIERPGRVGWFLGFGLTSWVVAGFAALSGYYVAGALGPEARAALIFVNPLYYALLLAGDLDKPAPRRAVLCGAAAASLAAVLPASMALLAAGLVGGTAAFLLGRRRGRG
ncbi:AzlC family ABC transporter permease [Roseomonas sp. JC162]|uniref:AzlC family ABC transporter permease n=1 Tax=Neoroseomonas marina TaxID=1232220 RepID=A0A848EA68_9PROT|nr:AzlC family ABC transporter permease [Neoroseomonas marina]NMJ40966.1 AzlC family ABC transporter permease [Neoroseomonas marina]